MRHNVNEIEAVDSRIRADTYGEKTIVDGLEDIAWLGYRLGEAHFCSDVKKDKPDLVWYTEERRKALEYLEKEKLLILYGDWKPGELQRIVLALLVKSLERNDHYVFHSSAINYKGCNILFMSGEANHGKTMSLIEAARRGAKIISTEGTIVDVSGKVLAGTKEAFLRRRPRGTERADIPPAQQGWRKFFDSLPEFKPYEGEVESLDLIILPDIDGHFDTYVTELSQFEREYQTFCCLTDSYYSTSIVISSGIPMPMLDEPELRAKRAQFVSEFTRKRPYYLIRAKTPAIVLDEVEKILRK